MNKEKLKQRLWIELRDSFPPEKLGEIEEFILENNNELNHDLIREIFYLKEDLKAAYNHIYGEQENLWRKY